MLEWMIMPLKRYAEFSGRSRRMEYWSYTLLNVVIIVVLFAIRFASGGFAEFAAAGQSGNPFAVYGVMFSGVGMLLAVWWLATFIPTIAVGVRRLHDRDMSGWWYLGYMIANFIPLVNVIANLAFLVLMFLEGTKGPDRFGPDPKNPNADAGVFSCLIELTQSPRGPGSRGVSLSGGHEMEWMLLPFRRYADFEGRSRRMEYWMYQVFTLAIYLVCGAVMLAGIPWGEMENVDAQPGPVFWMGVGMAGLWYLVTFIPDIAVTVRRFHDQDMSGWMYLLRFIPYLGGLVVMVFMFIDGQRNANRFGADPKNPNADAGVFS